MVIFVLFFLSFTGLLGLIRTQLALLQSFGSIFNLADSVVTLSFSIVVRFCLFLFK